MDMLLWTVHGETTCSRCMDLAGRLYTPGTEPQCPLHDNCDCSLQPVTIEEGGGGGGTGGVDCAALAARVDAIEARLDAIETTLATILATLQDTIGSKINGAATQVAVFSANDVLGGSSTLYFNGVTLLGPLFRATGIGAYGGQFQAFNGGSYIALDGTNHGLNANGTIHFNHSAPSATDLPSLISALAGMGLISAT